MYLITSPKLLLSQLFLECVAGLNDRKGCIFTNDMKLTRQNMKYFVHIVCNEIQVKVNLEITIFVFEVRVRRWDAGEVVLLCLLVAACISITHYSLDILITYCHMTHTYRALGVGTLNGIRRAVCSFSLPSGASAHFSILSCT